MANSQHKKHCKGSRPVYIVYVTAPDCPHIPKAIYPIYPNFPERLSKVKAKWGDGQHEIRYFADWENEIPELNSTEKI